LEENFLLACLRRIEEQLIRKVIILAARYATGLCPLILDRPKPLLDGAGKTNNRAPGGQSQVLTKYRQVLCGHEG
jgi:hypothetical protein